MVAKGGRAAFLRRRKTIRREEILHVTAPAGIMLKKFRLLFWIGHYFRLPSLALLALQKRYGPLRDRHITTTSAGLYASHGGNRCPISYKRIEPLPQARRLVLIMPSLTSKSFVHYLTTSIWQFYACGAAFTPSVTAIAAAHTNAQQMLTS